MTDEKCCGQPDGCTADCAFAATASRYVADHVHNHHGAVETGVVTPTGDEIRSSTLFRVLGKKPDAAHYGELLRDAPSPEGHRLIRRKRSTPRMASATPSCRCTSGHSRRPRMAAWHCWTAC